MAAPTYNFGKYSGTWNRQKAAHLLRRTMFAPTRADIDWSVSRGLDGTLNELFRNLPLPRHPINIYYSKDPDVPSGSSWVDRPYRRSHFRDQRVQRDNNLRSWTYMLMFDGGRHIREKLTLFWHNHFPVNTIPDPKYRYWYYYKLRKYALGDFKQLGKEITIDPAMLRFLDGRDNKDLAPNENYAREMLELFTIGKGEQNSPGDYTTFTEQDVREIARALTGWRDYGITLTSRGGRTGTTFDSPTSVGSSFNPAVHDSGTKRLSHRFNNATIPNLGDKEYARVVDIIFEQDEVSRFICRRLYTWFVYHKIDGQVERNIIEPMARTLRNNNYRIGPALRQLLQSAHFYDSTLVGGMIQSPLDWVFSVLKTSDASVPTTNFERNVSMLVMESRINRMQQQIFEIPEVAGWSAYYLQPGYYRAWISSSTIRERLDLIGQLIGGGVRSNLYGQNLHIRIDKFATLEKLSNPLDVNDLIEELVDRLLPMPEKVTSAQYDMLKEALIPGLPDFEWTVEYRNYLRNPGDFKIRNSVDSRLYNLFMALYSLPQAQLS